MSNVPSLAAVASLVRRAMTRHAASCWYNAWDNSIKKECILQWNSTVQANYIKHDRQFLIILHKWNFWLQIFVPFFCHFIYLKHHRDKILQLLIWERKIVNVPAWLNTDDIFNMIDKNRSIIILSNQKQNGPERLNSVQKVSCPNQNEKWK